MPPRIPRKACSIEPSATSSSTTRLTSSTGVANPTPSTPTSDTPTAVVIPISLPSESTRAPPLDPWVMGASVCSIPNRVRSGSVVTWRPKADSTPTVTDGPPSRPRGLPTATAASPTLSSVVAPSSMGTSPAASMSSTARSVTGSVPMRVAS